MATLAMAVLIVPPIAQAGPASVYGPDDLELVRSEQLRERLLELRFRTPAVEGETGVRVLLPDGYADDPTTRYPVLYLLHGCCNGHTGYSSHTEFGPIERLTAGLPLIVVMPDSGPVGGYMDWYNDGAGGPPMWETYHIGQLVPWVDRTFRTRATREARAVVGGSMGGYGAMEYGARHPDLFAAASAYSGAVDTNSVFIQATAAFDPAWDRAGTREHGPRATQEVRWRGRNPWDLAENLVGMDLTLRTGNGEPGGPGGEQYYDPVEAEVHQESVSLHRRLSELGIAHTWDDYGPGCHCAYYWDRSLEQLVSEVMQTFADPPPPPSPFSYRSIESTYEVFGWHVDIERPAVEFSELSHASRTAFAVRGSGTATVTTPPLYEPGARLNIERVREGQTEAEVVSVDSDCRLRLQVPLGPGNPYQQYSAEALAYGTQQSLWTPGTAPTADKSGTTVYTTRVQVDATETPGCAGSRKKAKR